MANKTCLICKNPFQSTSRGRKKYCSNKCQKMGCEVRLNVTLRDACPRCGNLKVKASKVCQKCFYEIEVGENCRSWKGGRLEVDGYIRLHIPDHPRADSRGYVAEHRLVWEKAHNKQLPKNWIVHHINGIRDDNRIENLEAMPERKHSSWTLLRTAQRRIRELEQLHLPIPPP